MKCGCGAPSDGWLWREMRCASTRVAANKALADYINGRGSLAELERQAREAKAAEDAVRKVMAGQPVEEEPSR